MTAPIEVGARVPIRLQLEDSEGQSRATCTSSTEVRSCRPGADGFVLGTRIVELEPAARVALMEWCYVVCSHQEVRGTRPGVRRSEPADGMPGSPAAPVLVPQPAARIERVAGTAAA